MRQDLADVTIVLDRSGSMGSCRMEAESAINSFVKEQKEGPGEILFSLIQFDTTIDWVHKGIPAAEVPEFELAPRGMTALLDALGYAINETGKRLSKMDEKDRPGLVVMAVMTDGQDNSSDKFSRSQIKEMIEHQTDVYNWQFTFLGANQNSFAEADSLGFQRDAVANYDTKSTKSAGRAMASNVMRMREQKTSGGIVLNSYSDEERSKMAGK